MKCDIAKKCGSCQFINQGYVKSLEYKNEEKEKIWLLASAVPGLMKGIN